MAKRRPSRKQYQRKRSYKRFKYHQEMQLENQLIIMMVILGGLLFGAQKVMSKFDVALTMENIVPTVVLLSIFLALTMFSYLGIKSFLARRKKRGYYSAQQTLGDFRRMDPF